MQQYDVCKLKHGEVVVILQHEAFSDFRTRMVAPLVPKVRGKLATSLNPVFRHARRDWVLAPQLMGPVHLSAIVEIVGSLEGENYAIKRAIDQLFLGI
jgi:CcdB protein